MSDGPRRYQIFFADLKRRKVFKVAAVYGAVSFAVLQAADIAFPRVGLPDWTITFVVALVVIGLPIAVLLAWALDVTPEGVRKTDPARFGELEALVAQPKSRRWPAGLLALAGMLLLVGGVWWTSGRDARSTNGGPPASGRFASIAVLPFVNMSGDEENEYFSDGITEEILNALAQLPGLKVVARTSAFQFKGEQLDLRDVGRQLNVAAILEGSVQRAGDDVRITAQLIDAETGFHLWSGKFDRRLEDIFAVEDEIARSIADTLRTPLGLMPADQLVTRATEDPEAYKLYLQGQFMLGERGASLMRAISLYESALALDPDFAAAHAGLAEAYALLPWYALGEWEESLAKAETSAHRALALDRTIARAYVALANVRRDLWDWETAEAHYDRALELAPNDAEARNQYAQFLNIMGRHQAALAQTYLYLELDPLSPILNAGQAHVLMFAGRYDEAIAPLLRAVELDPNFRLPHRWLMWAYLLTDRFDEAEAAGSRASAASQSQRSRRTLVRAVQNPESKSEALKILATSTDRQSWAPGLGDRALWYVLLGENELALKALTVVADRGLGNVNFQDPMLRPLRDDPRFQELLERVGLSQ